VVAEKSGVPLGTLRKIAYEEVTDPRFWTVKKLADHFREQEALRLAADADRRAGERRTNRDRRGTGNEGEESK
jgi:hypothetical protein